VSVRVFLSPAMYCLSCPADNTQLTQTGPGSPSDFHLSTTIQALIDRKISIFGVCLGLQGLVEYFGGSLDVLEYPMHGKASSIKRVYDDFGTAVNASYSHGNMDTCDVLNGLPAEFQVARYHSLHGQLSTFPADLKITAVSDDGCVMAVQHKVWPIAAVQFHPESILTLPKHGMKILLNALDKLKKRRYS
jgi:anthranilate synthase